MTTPDLSRRGAVFSLAAALAAPIGSARGATPPPTQHGKSEPDTSHPEPADRPGASTKPAPKTAADDLYRPWLHFTPATGFMNDPNGMVFDGTHYHLYYQFDPFAPYAGRVHWGHAISTDMLHWQDQPIAIPQTPAGEAFSGSAVIDAKNTCGLFTTPLTPAPQTPPSQTPPAQPQAAPIPTPGANLVAIYTRASARNQSQYLAWSTDNGRTFTEYHTPVLDIGSNSFRDPKVFFHTPTGRWIMVLAKSREHKVGIYGSIDLIHWMMLSDFGPTGLLGVDYECPNLIEVPFDEGGTRWVMFVSVNPGAPQGGSITQYFVGDFNGTEFIAHETTIGLTDFAKDNYALQCFDNMPNDEAVGIAWLSNWQYCEELPNKAWRGVMTLPRTLSLTRDHGGWIRLVQMPRGIETLRDRQIAKPLTHLDAGTSQQTPLPAGVPVELNLHITMDERPQGLEPGDKGRAGRFIIVFANENGETLSIGFDAFSSQIWLDRSDLHGFTQPFFTGQFSTALQPDKRDVTFRLVLDACTLELFVDGGTSVGTALVFPSAPLTELRLEASGAGATIHGLEVHTLKKAMDRPGIPA